MAISKHHCYEALILGTGAGATHVYSGEASSSFVVLEDGQPALLCDLVGPRPGACVPMRTCAR